MKVLVPLSRAGELSAPHGVDPYHEPPATVTLPAGRFEGYTRGAVRPALFAFLLAACGARTGLLVDDATAVPPDAGIDAGPDAPPPECVAGSACDDGVPCTRDRCDVRAGRCLHEPDDVRCADGLTCNGAERCDARLGCVAGAPRACGDGVACTVDRCDEPGRCASTPDDLRCPISHRCDLTRGCVARALANAGDQLYEVELPSGVLRPLARIRAFTDVALHPDRSLWAVTVDGALYRFDAASNFPSIVAATGQPLTALDAAPDGALYAAGRFGLFRLDRGTGAATPVARFPDGLEASGDIAFLQGRLLVTARTGPDALDDLVEFDLAAGAARTVGPVGFRCVWGLAAFGATLYGLTCTGDVLRLDPATGRGVRIAQRPGVTFYGATAR